MEENHSLKHRKSFVHAAFIFSSFIIVAAITWAILAISHRPIINDEFFVSDNTKTTITISSASPDSSSSHQTRVVYEYDGENVISMKTYFEYQDADAAKNAYESLKDLPEFKNAELNDKYIIVTADESQYKGLTASDVRQQADALKSLQEESQGDSTKNE